MIVLVLTTSPGLAALPDWAALRESAGWEQVADRTIDIGEVTVEKRELDATWCLRAHARSAASPERLIAVLWDVPGATRWSSNPLAISEVLVPGDDHMVMWQHLDLPGWMLVHDRYWVLAVDHLVEDGTHVYRWTQQDAATRWPTVAARASGIDPDALQPPVMWGEWAFAPAGDHTDVTWRGCSDIGGRIPGWLQAWASTRSLPSAVADLVHEAER